MKFILALIIVIVSSGIIAGWIKMTSGDEGERDAILLCKGKVISYEEKLVYDQVICDDGTIYRIYGGE